MNNQPQTSIPAHSFSPGSAAAIGLANCHSCGQLSPHLITHCPRCHARLHLRTPYSLQKTLAFLLTALIFYIPANLFPIMTSEQLGVIEATTIIGGIIVLWEMGSYPIAVVVFVASVLVPIVKFIILFWLCYCAKFGSPMSAKELSVLYRTTEFIGRWSMVDVFVVAVLVALIQLGTLLNVQPGIAAITFAMMVILTIIAAQMFDPRLLWDRLLVAPDNQQNAQQNKQQNNQQSDQQENKEH